VSLNCRVCAGIKGKQEKNAAIPHGINDDVKVLASIGWAHEYQSWRLVFLYLLKEKGKESIR
jgi:hypothetical protein